MSRTTHKHMKTEDEINPHQYNTKFRAYKYI